jgi:hypothetical protein
MFKFSEGMRGAKDYAQTSLVGLPYLNTPEHIRKDRGATTVLLGPEGALGGKAKADGESYLGQAVGSGALRGLLGGAALGGATALVTGEQLKRHTEMNRLAGRGIDEALASDLANFKDTKSKTTGFMNKTMSNMDIGATKLMQAYRKSKGKTIAGLVAGGALGVGAIGGLGGAVNYGIGRAVEDGPVLEKNGSEGMRGISDYAQASLVPLPYLSTPAHVRRNREVATLLLGTEGALGSKSVDDNSSYLGQATGLGALRGAMIGTTGGAIAAGIHASELNHGLRDAKDTLSTMRGVFTPGSANQQLYDKSVAEAMAAGAKDVKNLKLKGAAKALGIGAAGGTAIGALMGSGAYGLGRVTADGPEVEKNGSYRAEILYSKLTQ